MLVLSKSVVLSYKTKGTDLLNQYAIVPGPNYSTIQYNDNTWLSNGHYNNYVFIWKGSVSF